MTESEKFVKLCQRYETKYREIRDDLKKCVESLTKLDNKIKEMEQFDYEVVMEMKRERDAALQKIKP